jgi:hypothetical protein
MERLNLHAPKILRDDPNALSGTALVTYNSKKLPELELIDFALDLSAASLLV